MSSDFENGRRKNRARSSPFFRLQPPAAAGPAGAAPGRAFCFDVRQHVKTGKTFLFDKEEQKS